MMAMYEILRLVWWLILALLLTGFAITDGFDMGLAAIFRFIGRDDAQRHVLLASIEPVWDGNQVWFIVAGAGTFAAWPLLYAASFSGLYLAMFLVLLALILRPVGFMFRNRLPGAGWRNTWDWALTVGGAVPALLFGVAVGNLFLGLPFHFDPLMRPEYTGGFFNLLHPYALLSGVVSLSMLVLHGACYAALKTGEPMAARARAVGRVAAVVFVVAFVLAGVWVAFGIAGHRIVGTIDPAGPSDPLHKQVVAATGAWLDNYHQAPVLWLLPLLAIAAALAAAALLRAGRTGQAFFASALAQFGTVFTAGTALFPFLMPSSSNPGQGLTVWDASSSRTTLLTMLVVVIIFLPIVLSYTAWVFRVLKGRVTLEHLLAGDEY